MESCFGGYSGTIDADVEIQKYCDQVKCEAEGRTNKKFAEFKAVKYRSKVVQGTNYLIKVYVGEGSYIHVQVHHKLPCDGGEIELKGVQENYTKDDPLVSF